MTGEDEQRLKLESQKQFDWESFSLGQADMVAFWFSRGSLNPTTRLEFGIHVTNEKPVFLGIDPCYILPNAIIHYWKWYHPGATYESDLLTHAHEIKHWIKEYKND